MWKLSDPGSVLPRLPNGARILIIRLRSLGDIVLETPALAALHSWRPDLRLSLLVEPAFAAVLEGNPAVDEVVFCGAFFLPFTSCGAGGLPPFSINTPGQPAPC
jgi:hypothetical protein